MIHDNENPDYHYNLFCQVKKNLYPRTEEFDMNCSNLTRTCFICHDPDIWVNPRKDEIEPYYFVYDPTLPYQCQRKRFIPVLKIMERFVHQSSHTSEEIETNLKWQGLWTDKQLINYADKG